MAKITTTVSPVLAALFVASDAAQATAEAKSGSDDALNEAWAKSHYAIASHPAETITDLSAKLTFMIGETMGEGQDWLPTILEDVQRIARAEAPEWSAALKAYEEATANDLAAGKALSAAEDYHQEDPHVEAVRALMKAEMLRNKAMDAQCAAIRALTNSPAPSLSALLVNMQIAIDTGMIANPDINDALKADLRRFSHYADKEA